jgi:hypothetical protein
MHEMLKFSFKNTSSNILMQNHILDDQDHV